MTVRIINANVVDGLAQLESESVHCVVTSPPYFGLRDYGMPGQIGMEPTPDAYVAKMVDVFREIRRVLSKDGTCWLNLGDSYAGGGHGGGGSFEKERNWRKGSGRADGLVDERGQRNRDGLGRINNLKPKDLIGIPWRVAFALQADGWWLRQDIIWSKPNPMPESVTDRCTKAHEYIFLLTKDSRYFYDAKAIAQPQVYPDDKRRPLGSKGAWAMDGREQRANGGGVAYDHDTTTSNKRSVWEVATQPFPEAHFATFPPALIEPCIKAGCPEWGTVLDPFGGSGTTGLVADRLKRNAILIELNPEYAAMAERRVKGDCPMFAEVSA